MFVKEKILNCMLQHKTFSECLETQLKEFYSNIDADVAYELEPVSHHSTNKNMIDDIARYEKRHSGKKANTKRSEDSNELLSFIRNAILRNYKLKSSIKTTRF